MKLSFSRTLALSFLQIFIYSLLIIADNKSFSVLLLNIVFLILIYSKDDKPEKIEVKLSRFFLSKLRPDISRTFKLEHPLNKFEKKFQ